MNPEQFHDALNYLDDDLISETDELRRGQRVMQTLPAPRQIIPWVASAACLALVLGFGPWFLPAMETDSNSNGSNEMLQDAQQPPKDLTEEQQIYEGVEANMEHSRSEYAAQRISCDDISMEIPETWDHEIVKEDGGGYFLVIRPPHEEGSVRVGYWPNFAVCGTGLATREVVIAGMDACVGTYDGSRVWSFITFGDDYVVINEGADEWWGVYGDLLMECLETLVIG
ncbi:MAG: hypothetical protein IJZ39_08920 [Oscillospiraceae bacterium]|nr:hypothetical protein [Oscillospiraceae bacterium]